MPYAKFRWLPREAKVEPKPPTAEHRLRLPALVLEARVNGIQPWVWKTSHDTEVHMIRRIDRIATELPPPSEPDPAGAAAVQELMGGRFGGMSTF